MDLVVDLKNLSKEEREEIQDFISGYTTNYLVLDLDNVMKKKKILHIISTILIVLLSLSLIFFILFISMLDILKGTSITIL